MFKHHHKLTSTFKSALQFKTGNVKLSHTDPWRNTDLATMMPGTTSVLPGVQNQMMAQRLQNDPTPWQAVIHLNPPCGPPRTSICCINLYQICVTQFAQLPWVMGFNFRSALLCMIRHTMQAPGLVPWTTPNKTRAGNTPTGGCEQQQQPQKLSGETGLDLTSNSLFFESSIGRLTKGGRGMQ